MESQENPIERSEELQEESLITAQDKEKIKKIIAKFSDDNGFVNFGEIAHGIFDQQTQYASRYIDGVIPGYPNLGEGLRFKGDPSDYHFVKIHKDDIEEFVRRRKDYLNHPEKYKDKIRTE